MQRDESHTNDWQDDYDEIKYIPTICEIVMAKWDHLQQTLPSEDDNEYYVNLLKYFTRVAWLVSSFNHHGYHVEPYQNHYYNVECLFCGEVKDVSLNFVLKKTKGGEKHIGGAINKKILYPRHIAIKIKITYWWSRNRFLWFLGAQLFHCIVVFLLFFSHEDVLTS